MLRLSGRSLTIGGAVLLGAATLAACSPTVRPAGPVGTAPMLTDQAMITRDGVRLPLDRWLPPDGAPKAVLLALHSFGDYRAAFGAFGDWFADHGYAVYAFDQRGFGGAPHFGLWPGHETMVRDLLDAAEAVEATHPDRPLYLLGESMGGSVILEAMSRPQAPTVAGLILAGPGVREGIRWRYLYNAALWVGAHTLPFAAATLPRDDNPKLTERADTRLSEDPNVLRRVRLDTYWGLIKLADAASAAAYAVNAPTFLLYGGSDGFLPAVSICHLADALKGPVTTAVYPDAPHLLMHVRYQTVLFGDILAWIEGRPPPSLEPGGRATSVHRFCNGQD